MPELPEVETVCRTLEPLIRGHSICGVDLRWSGVLEGTNVSDLNRWVGARIQRIRRRGKMLLLDGDHGLTMLIHLKMTGQLFLARSEQLADRHVHLILRLDEPGLELRFRDPRKFGRVRIFPSVEEPVFPPLSRLGPEPDELNPEEFISLFRRKKGRIKPLLLRQDFIAGIGNIYADEILHSARIHPESAVSSLSREDLKRLYGAMRRILARAIRYRGTSIRDYRNGLGQTGSFQLHLRVYGRAGKKCPRCRGEIRRKKITGRSAFFCSRCQRRK